MSVTDPKTAAVSRAQFNDLGPNAAGGNGEMNLNLILGRCCDAGARGRPRAYAGTRIAAARAGLHRRIGPHGRRAARCTGQRRMYRTAARWSW